MNHQASSPPRSLTAKEKKVLEFIESYILKRGIAPSYQEIKEHFGFASFNSVQKYLKQLQNKEYIYIPAGNQKRAITVLQSSQTIQNFMNGEAPTSSIVNLTQQPLTTTTQQPFLSTQHYSKEASPLSPPAAEPLFLPLLGRVAAGQPIEAIEYDEYVQAPSHMVQNAEKTFALKVEGQSMIEDGILNGDIIFVQEQEVARNGETVVAMVNNEATVKKIYFYKEPPKEVQSVNDLPPRPMIELRPSNSSMQSFWYPPEDVTLKGIVVGLIRSM